MKSFMLVVLLGVTVLFTVAGQLLVKGGTRQLGPFPTSLAEIPSFAWAALTNPLIMLGLASAAVAAVAWIGAVSLSAISVVYPFMGLAVVLVLALSPLVFGEAVPLGRWLGVTVVCIGLLIAARA